MDSVNFRTCLLMILSIEVVANAAMPFAVYLPWAYAVVICAGLMCEGAGAAVLPPTTL